MPIVESLSTNRTETISIERAFLHVYRIQPPPHSYDAFASHPAISRVDAELAKRAKPSKRVFDVGTGTGAMLQHLSEQAKLLRGYFAVGLDPDKDALKTAQEKFAHPQNNVRFVQGIAEKLPFSDNFFDLVVQANNIHLTNAFKSFCESHRVLRKGGMYVVSTAYELTHAYDEETASGWGTLPAAAKRVLAKIEIDGRKFAGEVGKPVDLRKYTKDDFQHMAQEAGFSKVDSEFVPVAMDADSLIAISDYYDFAKGALPGVPLEFAYPALKNAVNPLFERMNRGKEIPITALGRNWFFIVAIK